MAQPGGRGQCPSGQSRGGALGWRAMDDPCALLAIVPAEDGLAVRRLFADFVARHRPDARIVGALAEGPETGKAGWLRLLPGGETVALFQDLGPGAVGCAVDQAAVVAAGEQVRRGIAEGADLVVLNKFGKLEAEFGSGLRDALVAAVIAQIPVLTSVAPRHSAAWAAFAGSLPVTIARDAGALAHWWQAVRAGA